MNKQSLQSFKRTLRERFSSLVIWTKHYLITLQKRPLSSQLSIKIKEKKNCESKKYFSQKHLKADV